ncbi:long-chain-acyl-CoA synthetase [Comamonas sp. Y33R10-2]|nr:long-chain-acyl-CoA synthetase [Comamonas sp. Y33R10-2]
MGALISREETQKKLDGRSAVVMKYVADMPHTIADRFEECAQRLADRPFLLEGDESYTYAQLNSRANQVARALEAQGVRKGDVVAMSLENRAAFFFVWLAVNKLGAVSAFMNTYIQGKPLVHSLSVTNTKFVVVGEECAALYAATEDLPAVKYLHWPDADRPADAKVLAQFGPDLEQLSQGLDTANGPAEWRAGVVGGDTAQYIFTSGTTGLPKAAVVSHARWLMSGESMQVLWNIQQNDRFYCFLPMYHAAASMSATGTALCAGASVVVRRKFSRSEFWSDVRRYGITFCQYVGEICRFLLSVPPAANDREHTLCKMSGTGMTQEIWQQWSERFGSHFQIFEGWGSTEANASTINVDNRIGSCGRVPFWEKTNLRLVKYDQETGEHVRDANGFLQLADVNEPGEALGMLIQYPGVMAGRFEGYTSAEATEKKILRNVFAEGDAWWSSGDLLRCDEDGYCWFVDRIGDTFRWKSENVSTMEVSDALGDFKGLDAITVYGVQVPGHGGRAGMAALVMQEGVAFDPKEFWSLALKRLPRYAAPQFVRLMAAPDMTGNYKLRKVDLQKQGYDSTQTSDPLFVRNDKLQTYVPVTDASVKEALSA